MTGVERVRVLHGHTSPETAYRVADYPYGRTLRCQIRYWIDTARKGPKCGHQRFVSQTADPRRDGTVWNHPKPGLYHHLMLLYLDGDDRVHHWGVSGLGITPENDAVFRLMGLRDQLTDDRRRAYDQLVAISQRHTGPWERWERTLAALTEHLRRTGEEDLTIDNASWISPTGQRHHLGDDRTVAACLTLARQRLTAPDA